MQTTSALRTTICCQCCRFAEQIQESLCDIFQSVRTSPLAACRNAWVARTRCAQTSCRLFPSIARLLAVPPNAALPPLAGNYLCEEDSLTYPMHYSAYNGNILKPAPSKSQRTAGQAEETGQNLFERCIYAMLLLREKRVVLSPMLERTAVCGK